jgi:hypothetical protein
MTVINISWYLCVLFIVALVAESEVTVAPGGESGIRLLMGTWTGLAVLFAAVAVMFRRLLISEPKWLVRVFQGVALVATLLVILMVVG